MNKTIWLGNDHGGYEMKCSLIPVLQEEGWQIQDVGSFSQEIVRYPNYAAKVCGAVASGTAQRGLLICSTGIGMSIIANKFKGVRAALCTTEFMGRMTREHNDSNILCLGGKITPFDEAARILRIWLNTGYIGGRHDISLGLIRQAEDLMMDGVAWPGDDVCASGEEKE